VRRVLAARPAELIEFQPARRGLLILGGGVIAILAITALQRNDLSRHVPILFVYFLGWAPGSLVRVEARISAKHLGFAEDFQLIRGSSSGYICRPYSLACSPAHSSELTAPSCRN
jgi:hypothetical protein